MNNIVNSHSYSVEKFRQTSGPVLDVRSPIEFDRGHIPGAINFALLSNNERAEIGIKYRIEGRDAAINLGHTLVGPRVKSLVTKARELAFGGTLRIQCARGGIRSRSLYSLMTETGIPAILLKGGYKEYRRWVFREISVPREFIVLRGLTGTGKTQILHELGNNGEQVLDLEGLANHRGSVFGSIGQPPQPSPQQFGNLIAERLAGFDVERPIWVEAESAQIGSCWLPIELIDQMKQARSLEIKRPLAERINLLTKTYGSASEEELIEGIDRLERRLGGKRAKEARASIIDGNLEVASMILLEYYDVSYKKHTQRNAFEGEEIFVTEDTFADAIHLLKKLGSNSATKSI